MIEEIIKEIEKKINRLKKTQNMLPEISEKYEAQYKGQMHELNWILELLRKKCK